MKRTNLSFLFAPLLLASAACGEVAAPDSGVDAAPAPTAMSVTPTRGPVIGGIQVTLSGAGLASAEGSEVVVLVGGVKATDAAVVDDGSVTFTLPPGDVAGATVDVTVATQSGFATLPDAFTYNLRPQVIGISPTRGRSAGGTTVTVSGRGFSEFAAGDASLEIDGVAATNVTVVDDQTITATIGAAPDSAPFTPLDVVVGNANGEGLLSEAFSLTAAGLLAVDRSTKVVYYIQPSTGLVADIGSLTRQINGCAANPSGLLFSTSFNLVDGTPELVTINPLTGSVTTVGPLRDAGDGTFSFRDIAFVGTTLFGSGRGSAGFRQINASTGLVTPGPAGVVVEGSIATKSPTEMYSVPYRFGTENRLDTVTSTGTVTGPVLTGLEPWARHVEVLGTEVFVAEGRFGDPRRVFRVNPATGALTRVAEIRGANGGLQLSALCPTPPSF